MKVPSISELNRIKTEITSIHESLRTLHRRKDELEVHIAKSYVHVDNIHRVFSNVNVVRVDEGTLLFLLKYKGYKFYCDYTFSDDVVYLRHNYRAYDLKLDNRFSCEVLEAVDGHIKIEDCYWFETTATNFVNGHISEFVDGLLAKRLENRKVETINGIDVYDYNRDSGMFPMTIEYYFGLPGENELDVLKKHNIEHEIRAGVWTATFNDVEELTLYLSETCAFNLDLSFTKYITASDNIDPVFNLDLAVVNREEVFQPYSKYVVPDNLNLRNPILLEEYIKFTHMLYGNLTLGDFNSKTFEFIFKLDSECADTIEHGTIFAIDKFLSDANVGVKVSEQFMNSIYTEELVKIDHISFEVDANVLTKECLNIIQTNFLGK